MMSAMRVFSPGLRNAATDREERNPMRKHRSAMASEVFEVFRVE